MCMSIWKGCVGAPTGEEGCASLPTCPPRYLLLKENKQKLTKKKRKKKRKEKEKKKKREKRKEKNKQQKQNHTVCGLFVYLLHLEMKT